MFDKDQVDYESPAQGMNKCSQCVHFVKEKNKCEIVSGIILPGDWCSKFLKRISKFVHISKSK